MRELGGIMEDGAWNTQRYQTQTFERYIRAIFEGASIGMSLADIQGRIIESNPTVTRILGYSRSELKGMTFADLTHPDDRGLESHLYQQLLRGDCTHYQVEKRYTTKGGEVIWARVSAALVGGLGGPPMTIRMMENITEERAARRILQQYQEIMQSARDIILVIDGEGQINDTNQAAVLTYGYSRDELLSMTIQQLRDPSTLADLERQFVLAKQGILFETLHRCKDGRAIPVEVSSKWVTIGDREVYLSMVRDISERKRTEDEIKYLSRYDTLTGLYNRAYFEEILHNHQQNARVLSIIFGDLNGLKQVNSALGDRYGDQLLVRSAEIIREVCGQGVLASRWGDDEFAILLSDADESKARQICDQIDLTCSRDLHGPIRPSLALGTASKHSAGESIQEICQCAEERMYRNKFLEQKSPRSYLVASLTRTLRERNLETEEHAQRLEQLAVRMGKAMGLSADKLDELRLLAALHDIGKVGIPDDILLKPGSLTPAEWKIMKTHSEVGYRIAETTPELVPIARAILTHHERWNGKGYPLGLKGEEIPLIARVISIVDAYDAMTNDRPYKQTMSHNEAMAEIARSAGSHFDPRLVEEFFRMFNQDLAATATDD